MAFWLLVAEMIVLKGRTLAFSGKDLQTIKAWAKEYGLSVQDTVTGMLWEEVMRKAREGLFKREKA